MLFLCIVKISVIKKIKATKKNINLFLMTETPFKIIKYSNYKN